MIGQEPAAILDQVAAARRYAALSGPFHPADAIATLPGVDATDAMVAISAHLASACDTQSGPDAEWVMREPVRQWILRDLADHGQLPAAVEQRRAQGSLDRATEDLLDALTGSGHWADAAVEEQLAGDHSREVLQRIAVALERAGAIAPAYGRLDALRATLGRIDLARRGELLLAKGFFGREGELKRIADWVALPISDGQVRGLFVTGAPGIGKSTLLDEAVRKAVAVDPTRTLVRLDFDRAGLDARDWIGLTSELARQVATQVPAAAGALREAQLEAASDELGAVRGKGEVTREQVPPALARAVGNALEQERRTLIVVLDTAEMLRSRGSTHPERVFAWLDQLVRLQVAPIALLVAGRGNAFDEAPHRIEAPILLTGLEPDAVDRMLEQLRVPEASFAAIRDLADGNPLAIRLAAKVVQEAGPEALADVRPGTGVATGLLYRILLARIGDDVIRTIAHPGLVIRRINADVIGEVLGPQLGLGVIEPARAQALFETLASEHWLVEEDPQTGFARHRPDIRAMMLPLLYREDPKGCARVDRAAAAWFARRPEPWCPVEAAYHRLQSLRRSRAIPRLDPEVLRQLDTDAIGELPPAAQDIVYRARGDRTTKFRGEAPAEGGPLDPYAASELRAVLEKGDWREGAYLYQRAFASAMFDARSEAADVARAYLWRAGRWTEARRLDDERRRLGGDDAAIEGGAPLDTLVRLEMWAEWRFGRLVARLRSDPTLASLAAGVRQRAVTADLSMGALGFALRRNGALTAPASSAQQDLVGTAFATWAVGLAQYGEQRDGAMLSRRRLDALLSARVDLDPADDAIVARLLAVDLPYASTVAALFAIREGGPDSGDASSQLFDYLGGACERVSALGALGIGGAHWSVALEQSTSVTRSLERLSGLGLLAEWLGAAAFEFRDADLRLLGRSAERWRRTTAGRWSYERPPQGWRDGWHNTIDVSMADRIAGLEARPDPIADSLDQLGAWSASGEPNRLLAALRRRFGRTLSGLDGEPAARVAKALLRAGVPSAYVPPVAVLVSRGRLTSGRAT